MDGQKLKALFAKYINHAEEYVCHVVEQEGTDYGWSLSEFNDEEIKALIELGAELLGENRCPVCGRERGSETANRLSQCLCRAYGLMYTHQDHGGRVLQFPFGACRVSDMCNWCDYDVIKKFCELKELVEYEAGYKAALALDLIGAGYKAELVLDLIGEMKLGEMKPKAEQYDQQMVAEEEDDLEED